MRKQLQHYGFAKSITLLLFAFGFLKTDPGLAGKVTSTCTTTSTPCVDARSGESRICTTTTCVDGDGNVLSTTTIVTLRRGTKVGVAGRSPTKTLGAVNTPIQSVNKQQPMGSAVPISETQHGGAAGGSGHK
jgi:hypothetical protein